jgi:hypothetical protein
MNKHPFSVYVNARISSHRCNGFIVNFGVSSLFHGNLRYILDMLSKQKGIMAQHSSDVTKLSVFGIIVAAWSTRFTQAEDMGFFLTVSGLVSRGYKLYVETYEIKDPLFFYLNAIFMKPFGIEGAFYLDIILTGLSLPLAFLVLIKLGLSRIGAVLSSFVFEFTLTGQFGEPLRTQTLGIFLTLLAIFLGLNAKWVAAGAVTALVCFSKLPMTVIPIIAIFSVMFVSARLQAVLKFFIGFASSFTFFVLLMLIRGELSGYLDMVGENFRYASTYQAIVGQTPGLLGHFRVWNSDNQRAIIFLFLFAYLFALVKSNLKTNLYLVTISVNFGVASYLFLTAMWPHHLQILCLSVLFNLASIFHLLAPNQTEIRSSRNSKHEVLVGPISQTSTYILLFSAMVFPFTSGAQISVVPQMNLASWNNPSWIKPPEIEMLESLDLGSDQIHFARLGVNDDLGFGAFLANSHKMVCMRHGLTGAESIASIDKYVSCLSTQPNVILIAPFYSSLSERPGNYQYYYAESQKILSAKFKCEAWNNSDYQLCQKI